MERILITDGVSPAAARVFEEHGFEADDKPDLSSDELMACIGGYDALVVRSRTKVSTELLEAGTNLKVVGRAGIGVDNIDLAAATARGVVVINTPYGNSITTAEHTIAMMMALARQIPQADRATQAGEWPKSRFMGVEIHQKSLGIIGCGNIGAIVAQLAQGLHMRVMACDPYLSPERAQEIGVERVTLERLLERADFITLHVPLNDETRGMIDAEALAKMKTGVRVIDCARGGLIVEADLAAAIASGKVAGAALDVFEVEPAKQNLLFGNDKVIATPHLGAVTAEAQENVAIQVAEQISDFLRTGAVSHAVNMPSITAEEAPRLKPYMKLAENLGSFAGQLTETGIKKVQLEYEGQAAELNTKPLTAIALQGLLAPVLHTVNMVSAPLVARERGIEVTEVKNDRRGIYQSLIRLTVTTERQSRSVAGSLFADNRPRLVEVKGIPIEAEVAAHMLYITNEDRPGTVGAIGKTLGDAGVNIATFHLGRSERGGDAISLIQVDDSVPDSVLAALRALPNVIQIKALHF
ncbi:MAG: phosphoglycerate dehydrogenase [Proteobacteria bacterium]|nr:phosphoglycerate dehydrogenase [Pseudomonadota bacterium]